MKRKQGPSPHAYRLRQVEGMLEFECQECGRKCWRDERQALDALGLCPSCEATVQAKKKPLPVDPFAAFDDVCPWCESAFPEKCWKHKPDRYVSPKGSSVREES